MKICDRRCHYAHYFIGSLMYCQMCGGLITDVKYILDCMKYWNKSSKYIDEYFKRLEEKTKREEEKDKEAMKIDWSVTNER